MAVSVLQDSAGLAQLHHERALAFEDVVGGTAPDHQTYILRLGEGTDKGGSVQKARVILNHLDNANRVRNRYVKTRNASYSTY